MGWAKRRMQSYARGEKASYRKKKTLEHAHPVNLIAHILAHHIRHLLTCLSGAVMEDSEVRCCAKVQTQVLAWSSSAVISGCLRPPPTPIDLTEAANSSITKFLATTRL